MTYLGPLFERQSVVRFVGAHNALTARIGQNAGFDGIWVSGLEMSASRCIPDANILTATDTAQTCTNISSAIDIPILVDMDCGFGDPAQVYYYTQMLEEAGVSGVCIEDKVYPKANSFSTRGQHLVSIDEFNLKIKAARKARSCNDFWIVARTEAFVAGHDADEALRRAENYADAGADAIVVQSARTDVSEVRAFGQSWSRNLPLIVIPTKYPNATIATLSALNVKGIIYANQGLRAAVAAMKNAYAKILEEGHAGSLESSIVEIEEIFSIQGEDFLRELEMTLGVK